MTLELEVLVPETFKFSIDQMYQSVLANCKHEISNWDSLSQENKLEFLKEEVEYNIDIYIDDQNIPMDNFTEWDEDLVYTKYNEYVNDLFDNSKL